MKNKLHINILFVTLFTLLVGSVNASTYSENYSVIESSSGIEQNDNRFMDGDFEAVYRFDMIVFDDKEIDEASQSIVENAVAKIGELEKDGKDFDITLVGHTAQANDDVNEKKVESKSYARSIQNWFTKSITRDESMSLSQEYVKTVEKKLIDENVSADKISLETRGAQDQIFTEIYKDDKKNSHGVFLTIYVAKKVEPAHTKSEVVEQKEPKVSPDDTKSSLVQDILKLNFEVNSDKILQNSYGEIQRFAKFLKEYPAYNVEIIGHTDSRGKAVLNMDLSERRALMTKRALVEEGVDASRLHVKGRGELEPIASNLTLEGREANRRIEIKLFLQK